MLDLQQHMDVLLLHKQGFSIRDIARQSGLSRNSVRKILRGQASATFRAQERVSSLDPFKTYLEQRLKKFPSLNAVRLHAELLSQGYLGGVHQVRRFLASLRGEDLWRAKATVRFETPPGHQAQADWFEAGTFVTPATGESITYYGFLMVLGFSRKLFLTFTSTMKLPRLIACHQEAFRYYQGVPAEVLYDNMKQVRIAPGKLQPEFADFARHYGFSVRTHKPYRPRTKGKVERAVDYVRESFLTGRSFSDLADLNGQALHWCDHTANIRQHATTQAQPNDLYQRHEQAALQALPKHAWRFVREDIRQVSAESLVSWNGARYSVPPQHVGQRVSVCACEGQVTIRSLQAPDIIVAAHLQANAPGQTIAAPEHLQELWKVTAASAAKRHPSPPPWEMRFDSSNVAIVPLDTYAEIAS